MSLSLAPSRGLLPGPSNASLKIGFEKGPGGNDHQASSGNARAELAARRIKGELRMRNTTSGRRRQTFVPQTNGRPALPTSGPVNAPVMTEDEAAKKFSALVLQYSRGDLAQASERTKEAAKHWKAGSRAPNSSSLITMARRLPIVRDWVISQIDMPDGPQPENPAEAFNAVLVGLQLAANLPGQEGAMARALLKKMQGGG